MKHISILFTAFMIFLFSCKTSNEGISDTDHTSLKKNDMIGTILNKELKTFQKGVKPEKHLFFKTGEKEYLINISDGYVTSDELLKYQNKEVKIKGEIKKGTIIKGNPGSFNNETLPAKDLTGEYISVYKLYK